VGVRKDEVNGGRILFLVAVACAIIGLCLVYVPGCKPPDMGNCTWDLTNHEYHCPEEKK
jgi:hypothetical protein